MRSTCRQSDRALQAKSLSRFARVSSRYDSKGFIQGKGRKENIPKADVYPVIFLSFFSLVTETRLEKHPGMAILNNWHIPILPVTKQTSLFRSTDRNIRASTEQHYIGILQSEATPAHNSSQYHKLLNMIILSYFLYLIIFVGVSFIRKNIPYNLSQKLH